LTTAATCSAVIIKAVCSALAILVSTHPNRTLVTLTSCGRRASLRVPIHHPHWSSDMSVFVKDAAGARTVAPGKTQ
jgi:hypothetical protein